MNVQFKKGALELCVLALLAERDYYGYELVDAIDEDLRIAEGSVYPLLKRLKDEGKVDTYHVESTEGPSRKYYRVTGAGKEYFTQLAAEWRVFAAAVARVLGEAR